MEYEKMLEEMEETIETILELLREKKYVMAREEILKNNPVDIAEILEEVIETLGDDMGIIVLRTLPKDVLAEVFACLPSDDQVSIITRITDKEISYIINELDFDDMIDVLEELPANLVNRILQHATKEERKLINTFLNYPENSAGSLMTPEYISLPMDMTVGQAMAHIKSVGMDRETIYTCYVKDKGRRLAGVVSLRTLVIADADDPIEKYMHSEDMVYVHVLDDQEYVSSQFTRYGFLAMPVLDNEDRLVGIITVDDIMDIIEEEATEDVQKMAGVAASTDEYMDMGVFRHVKSRLPWLAFLMVSLMVTGLIITRFEVLLSEVLILVSYLPLLMGTGGNSGSQAAALIVRSLAVGDLTPGDAGRVLWKEFRIGFILGIILSAINFAKVFFLDHQTALVAFTVSLAIVIILVIAKLLGSMLPMLAKKIGIDPALMATPMIASVSDMITVIVYFWLASVMLGIG
ncbi:MAG: magnesium transporter [Clostridiales bacterium]|nr:magnesium transporter [Clostridiales bacterium]